MNDTRLPAGFEALEPFVAAWAADDFQQRFEMRFASAMPEIQRFYDAIQPLAEAALSELERHPLDGLPDDAIRLHRLLMALAHVAVAVERHKQPRPRNIRYPTTLRVVQGVAPA